MVAPLPTAALNPTVLNKTTNKEKPFTPWNRDLNKARALLAMGIAWLVVGCYWCSINPAPMAIGATFLSVPFLYAGLHVRERGKKRKHGSAVERQAAKKFIEDAPKDWLIKEGLYLGKQGDVDLLVSLPNGETCSIEIKSWRKAGYTARTIKAVFQALNQQTEIRSKHGIVWLPMSEENKAARHYKNILVVEGNETLLINELQKLDSRFFGIRFPAAPNEDLRTALKKQGFRWNKEYARWEGRCASENIKRLAKEIESEQGQTFPIKEPTPATSRKPPFKPQKRGK